MFLKFLKENNIEKYHHHAGVMGFVYQTTFVGKAKWVTYFKQELAPPKLDNIPRIGDILVSFEVKIIQ